MQLTDRSFVGEAYDLAKKLDIAFWDYDRTRAQADGTVKIDGVDGTFHSAPVVTEIFRGMIADRCFDVAELVLTYFLRTFKDGKSPFVAIPIFPNPAFRHPAIFINKARAIKTPEDLTAKLSANLPCIATTPALCLPE